MSASTIARPTECAAVGLTKRRPTRLSDPMLLLRLSTSALRRGDQCGARLFAFRYLRALACDEVGVR